MELGLYRVRGQVGGYRLLYQSGQSPKLSLLSASAGRRSQLVARNLKQSLEDKRPHKLKWTRNAAGEMAVSIDGLEILRVADRWPEEKFDGFLLVNQGGDYIINRISIAGTG